MIDLQPIFAAVRQAADLTRRVQQKHLVSSQKDTGDHVEPVTIADYGSQAILCRAISTFFAEDAVLAEEHADQFGTLLADDQRAEIVKLISDVLGETVSEDQVKGWLDHGRGVEAERTWVIDPIDGTKGFIAMRRYSIAVGLLDRGLPIAGVLGSPGYPTPDGKGLLFYAQRGAAHVEPMKGGKAYRVAVSQRTKPRDLKVVESVERDHAALELMAKIYAELGIDKAKQVEGIDSQDKYAMLACGDADLYLRLPREAKPKHKSWDNAAGVALVQAAGGVVTDIDGSMLDFTTGAILSNNLGMVVTNGAIHDRVLEVVQAAVKIVSARLAPLKNVLILLLLIAIPLVILVVINVLFVPAAPAQVDDPPGFQILAPDTSVSVANYQLAYSNHSLILTNTLTRAAATIAENYVAAAPPAYTLFTFQSRPYLITRLGSSGSSGIYGFKVIRLDQDQAEDLTDPTSNPNLGLSCSNPRFDGSALIFEISLQCTNGAAVHDSSYQSYSIPLK